MLCQASLRPSQTSVKPAKPCFALMPCKAWLNLAYALLSQTEAGACEALLGALSAVHGPSFSLAYMPC